MSPPDPLNKSVREIRELRAHLLEVVRYNPHFLGLLLGRPFAAKTAETVFAANGRPKSSAAVTTPEKRRELLRTDPAKALLRCLQVHQTEEKLSFSSVFKLDEDFWKKFLQEWIDVGGPEERGQETQFRVGDEVFYFEFSKGGSIHGATRDSVYDSSCEDHGYYWSEWEMGSGMPGEDGGGRYRVKINSVTCSDTRSVKLRRCRVVEAPAKGSSSPEYSVQFLDAVPLESCG